ncbi:SGNH/GDSL hydrolase family protein [Pedomonas mirosovicensis]|uniref:SGNH/GDSL hydrolase family protein n=1 Tax=Pedomonas mirosovicensis TaxID=2908641 RepID=UPI0021675BB2|nr:SGNH/GDSL hydrolase family protein [Pedomonas mirosovicensis]MCH8685318.1 SGNH/GDSL hydrolase family protein [Pedomonas mirosovicensis]
MLKLLSALVKTSFVAAALLLPTIPASATPYSEIYVFGDSLVDAGNIGIVSPGTPPGAAGYFNGRFTNGPVYTDLLYQARFGSYMAPSLAGGTNYAFGGARAVDNSGYPSGGDQIPDLAAQLDLYAMNSGGTADSGALYIINIMGNDVFAVMNGNTNGLDPTAYAAQVAAVMAEQIQRLHDMGARHILLTGVPNADIPEAFLMQALLDSALDGLLLETELMTYSYLDLFTRILADPTSVGLPAGIDMETPCLVGETPSPDIDCTGYFFFDGTHPTAALHEILAREIGALTGITEVSEPAALALMGFGLAALALGGRRRRA